jgi:hypothetical protein
MKTYTVLFAEDVPHYGTAEIHAEDDNAALEAAKAYPLSEVTNDAEWENSACRRIVWIEDSDGNTIVEDVSLDDCFLRYGGDKERTLCDAAPRLLTALENAEKAIEEATDIMHYEDGQPVTALDGSEIERAYGALCSVLVEVHEAIESVKKGGNQ